MGKKVLIVDDVYSNRYVIEEVLEDYDVSGVSNGEEMWAYLKTDIPDIILMDVNLPLEDGFELTKELKNNAVTKDIPVLFLTVHNTKMDVLRAVRAGGADFITKPFDQADFRERVEKAISHSVISRAEEKDGE